MSEILYLDQEEIDQLIKGKKVLVGFYAIWVGLCKMISSNINKYADNAVSQGRTIDQKCKIILYAKIKEMVSY